jgi:leucyl aminopeptidase
MLGPDPIRPSDVITTAAGLTVEVTNPDAEGRLILADALVYSRARDAARIVDLATLTGAIRAGMGDLYGGVFANDDAWRAAVVDAGNAAGDLAWPWPLHPR